MADDIELQITANSKYLCIVRMAAQKVAEIVGMSEKVCGEVSLAMEEALTNVIRHGYGGECDKPIIIKLHPIPANEKVAGGVEIEIRDYGKQVPPEEIEGRDLDDFRPGGLGIHIIKSVMDKVEYSCPLESGMLLRMIKYEPKMGFKPG